MNNIYNFSEYHNKNRTIGSTNELSFEHITRETGGRLGIHDIPCPCCGPSCRTPANRRRKVMRVWHLEPGFASYYCKRCGGEGYVRDSGAPRPDPAALSRFKAEAAERERISSAEKLEKARWLWSQRLPVEGSVGERYLREARGYGGPIPATLGFLSARGRHQPAIIAAFGLPQEIEPGIIAIADDAVVGVHLTRLLPDGSNRQRGPGAKIRIGVGVTEPIVLAPPNDLLGLVIAEGIEDALTAHQATGLGAWASGGASFLPGLAGHVPSYVEVATIIVDDNDAGRRGSGELAKRLDARGIEVVIDGWLP
jgi:Toprim domain